jgi:hypothetical protein
VQRLQALELPQHYQILQNPRTPQGMNKCPRRAGEDSPERVSLPEELSSVRPGTLTPALGMGCARSDISGTGRTVLGT